MSGMAWIWMDLRAGEHANHLLFVYHLFDSLYHTSFRAILAMEFGGDDQWI